MKRTDDNPSAIILLDVDDPICQDKDFIGMVEHGKVFAWHTFGQETEKLRADKTNPEYRGCMTLRGKYAFEVFQDCLTEFIARVMVCGVSRSLTFIEAAKFPDGGHGMQFILATVGPLPNHDSCTPEPVVAVKVRLRTVEDDDVPSPFYQKESPKRTLN